MKNPKEAYQPTPAEQANAEGVMTQLQKIQSEMRDEVYGQLNEKQKESFRTMMAKADAIIRTLREQGRLDQSAAEMLQDYTEKLNRVRAGEPVATIFDTIKDLPEFQDGFKG